MKALNIISYNVNGINNPIKRKKLLVKLKKEKGDIIFLQETHLVSSEHEKLKKLTNAQVYYSSYKSCRRGVAVLIMPQIGFTLKKLIADKEGRYVMVVGMIEHVLVSFMNVYNPPEEGPDLIKKVVEMIVLESQGVTIAAGDFNLIMDPSKDTQSVRLHSSNQAAKIMRGAMKEIGLTDVWRALHPKERDYTFFSKSFCKYSRLDYFFMFKNHISMVAECHIKEITLSDHALISLKLNFDLEKGQKTWRLNNSLLQIDDFKTKIKLALKNYLEINDTGEVDPLILWEGMKVVLRGEIISFASYKKKEREKRTKELEQSIKTLESKHKETGCSSDLQSLNKLRNELDRLLTMEAEKALVFTKQKYFDSGAKAMKNLAYKLKKQQEKSNIVAIKNQTRDVMVKGKRDIAHEFAKYYEQLYSSDNNLTQQNGVKEYLSGINLPQVTVEQNANITSAVTPEEIMVVIKKLKNGKCPGSDGFTGEFYKEFSKELLLVLERAFNWALNHGQWANTWRNSIVTVIHKEGKDPTSCGSYRPITLLNVDQKLLSSIIANRLSKIIPFIIDPDQTGFIPDRYLSDNVRRTLNIIDFSKKMNTQTLILTLDAEKAFDRVSWPFIFETCSRFGFHDTFIKWLHAMYSSSKAQIRVNGTLSHSFELQRGTRQGDPLSPLIFAICIEPLAACIRATNKIEGVKVAEQSHKLALYADDVVLYLTNLEKSLPALMEVIDNYSNVSGYKLNIQKCEAMVLGAPVSREVKSNYPWQWDRDRIKYLGTVLPENNKLLYQLNYKDLEAHVRQDLHRWKLAIWSLGRRIDAIRMNVLPRFLFLFQTIPLYICVNTFKIWDTMIGKFIWDDKKPRVKMKTLKMPKERGGLALPNLKHYYMAAQMKHIRTWLNDNSEAKWRSIEMFMCHGSIKTILFCTEYQRKVPVKDNISIRNTLEIWARIKNVVEVKKDLLALREIKEDPEFMPNKTDDAFDIWAQKGLTIFGQCLNEKGIIQFESLSKAYRLPHSHFFRYLQIRSYIQNSEIKNKTSRDLHPLVQFLIKNYDKN